MNFHKYRQNINKYLLISIAVFVILFNSFFLIHNSARADITTGLVGYWKFDEGSGTTATDSSGNNNIGTLTNGPTWTTGKIGEALSFDGVNDYVNAGKNTSINNLGPLTYSAWVYPKASSKFQILNKRYRSLYLDSTYGNPLGLVFFVSTNNQNMIPYCTARPIQLNAWTHVAVVWNGVIGASTTGKFYVNGVSCNFSGNLGVGTTYSDVSMDQAIGASNDGGSFSEFFNGNIDEVRIYNRALSTGEITELYNYTGGSPTPTPSNTPSPTPSSTPSPTPIPDTTPPIISNSSPSGTLSAGTTQTTMSVSTNENATCKYSTSASTAYGLMANMFLTTGGTNHSSTITGLSNGQNYNYYIRCQDNSSNANASDYALTFSVAPSGGGTITAASCSYADVSAAITNIARGGTVIVPAGSCTWSSTLNITKGLTLAGAGADVTTITRSGNIIIWTPDAPARASHETLKITGFTFDGNGNTTPGMIYCSNTSDITYIAIGNNKFKNSTASAVKVVGTVYGVVYSNSLIDVNIICGIFGTGGVHGDGESQWANNVREYGTANNLYFEDNTFSYTQNGVPGWTESGHGGRVVFRYNTWDATNTVGQEYWDIHGLQYCPSAQQYSTMVAEYYGNMITNTSAYRWILHRGSWLMMFNNRLVGGSSNPNIGIGQYSCDECAAGREGYTQHVNNTYVWNNTVSGTRQDIHVQLDYCNDRTNGCAGFPIYTITENRDFYNYNPSFDGTAGIGCGPVAPTMNCTTGVGYWVTNAASCSTPPGTMADMKTYTQAGKFYKCTSTNIWTPYYTPYTYPHPLRSDAGTPNTTPPAAPTGVVVN